MVEVVMTERDRERAREGKNPRKTGENRDIGERTENELGKEIIGLAC